MFKCVLEEMKLRRADRFLMDELDNYMELTYLKKSDIVQIYLRFTKLGSEVLTNFHHRFEKNKILEAFPELNYNPFIDRIFHVFSSLKDEKMSFEDVLDLASAFSEVCPVEVKAKWAFLLFDFSDDDLLSRDDIVEMVARLTRMNNEEDVEEGGLLEEERKQVADIIFKDLVTCNSDGLTCIEFINIVKRIPEFVFAFRIKFS